MTQNSFFHATLTFSSFSKTFGVKTTTCDLSVSIKDDRPALPHISSTLNISLADSKSRPHKNTAVYLAASADAQLRTVSI